MKVSKRTIALARRYAPLAPEIGYPDCSAAIILARALLRALGLKVPK